MKSNGDVIVIVRDNGPGLPEDMLEKVFDPFVRVENSRKLIIPDYNGNNLFNTLGNIQLNPKAGLLFVDFENGQTLQLTGSAKINWDESARESFAGAQRLIEFEIEEVRETENSTRLHFDFRTYSPFNPVLQK